MAGKKILVIEDDLYYQTYVRDLLREADFEVLTASDGEEGVAAAFDNAPDIILTDIELPKVHGFMVLRQIKADPRTSHLPVLMMSGRVERSLLEKHAQMRVRASGYLIKPFSAEELINSIETVLSGAAGEAPGLAGGEGWPEEPDAADDARVRESTDHFPGKTALVVDDSPYICDITRKFLEEIGLSVHTAMDGKSGLDLTRELVPDIVLLDVQMPELNGFAVCEAVKRDNATSNVPVLLMSAVVDQHVFDKHAQLDYKADGYITKPFMKRELQATVGGLLSKAVEVKAEPPVPLSSKGAVTSTTESPPVAILPPPEITLEAPEPEETLDLEPVQPGVGTIPDNFLEGRLEAVQAELDQSQVREGLLENELQDLREELEAVKQDREASLQEAVKARDTIARLEEELEGAAAGGAAQAGKLSGELEKAVRETEGLKRDLEAALSAKEEVEQQAQALLATRAGVEEVEQLNKRLEEQGRQVEDLSSKAAEVEDLTSEVSGLRSEKSALENRVSELTEKVERLEKYSKGQETENLELVGRVNEIGREKVSFSSKVGELEEVVNDLKEKLQESGEGREELEDSIRSAEREKTRLMGLIEEISSDRDRVVNRQRDLEESHAAELDRIRSESAAFNRERDALVVRLEEADARVSQLQFQMKELAGSLEETRAEAERSVRIENRLKETDALLQESEERGRELRERLTKLQQEAVAEREQADVSLVEGLGSRLDNLENTLVETVKETRDTVTQRTEMETGLEEQVQTLMAAMEAERESMREERKDWSRREENMRTIMEEAIEEQRRVMGEEVSRLYPVQIPPQVKTLEVVSGMRKWGVAAVVALLALLLFVSGYLVLSRIIDRKSEAAIRPQPEIHGDTGAGNAAGSTVNDKSSLDRWGDVRKRHTISAVSGGSRVQATWHDRAQLEAALMLDTRQRGQKSGAKMAEMDGLLSGLDLENFYYISLFLSVPGNDGVKNDVGGLINRLGLRDGAGNEVPAMEVSRYGRMPASFLIRSSLGQAGGFTLDEGMLVRFPRAGLAVDPGDLSLVLYDVGDMPVQLLTWNRGSLAAGREGKSGVAGSHG